MENQNSNQVSKKLLLKHLESSTETNYDNADTPPVMREEDPDLEAKLDVIFKPSPYSPDAKAMDDF
mgnify:CR=1 FL=1